MIAHQEKVIIRLEEWDVTCVVWGQSNKQEFSLHVTSAEGLILFLMVSFLSACSAATRNPLPLPSVLLAAKVRPSTLPSHLFALYALLDTTQMRRGRLCAHLVLEEVTLRI